MEEQDQPKVCLKDDEKRHCLSSSVVSLEALSDWKEIFYREMQMVFDRKGVNVNVKSFLRGGVTERWREVYW